MMKLFAWQPSGHGPYSFFVCAENQADAELAVNSYIKEHLDKNDGHYLGKFETEAWQNGDLNLKVLDALEVVTNCND